MLFEICNALCDHMSAKLIFEYSIDVTLKNLVFKWNYTKIMYTFIGQHHNFVWEEEQAERAWYLSCKSINALYLLWIVNIRLKERIFFEYKRFNEFFYHPSNNGNKKQKLSTNISKQVNPSMNIHEWGTKSVAS